MSVWQKQKNWLNEVLWKPKKSLSIDQLKFQYQVLLKNPNVTENNRQLLVETFRSITEILIWGDQNDSRVFDFFLEKNMQSFFLKILTQKCGRYVSIQLLQTLNILFENIKNETSTYYLLSNNHINSIIVLKLDFSDEEILAYYISFLKTLSFHLNKHTIHFFYNEHLRDFPLYAEAIKFFKHSESMVRIAVRTLTLNVYRVDDKASLEYICNKTAAPYFSNMVWFIGNHVIELDECLIAQAHRLSRGRLEQLVAEHLDHLHYIADIFSLDIQCLNDILSDHFLNRLLIPLYVYSLTDKSMADAEERRPRISGTLALFLLSQVFLILSHSSVITPLAYLVFTGDTSLTLPTLLQQGHQRSSSYANACAFVQPETSLDVSLTLQSSHPHAISIEGANSGSPNSFSRFRKKSNNSMASSASIDGYVDTVVDQYVVIEASPSSSTNSMQSHEVPPVPPAVSPASPSALLSGVPGLSVPSQTKSATSPPKSPSADHGDRGVRDSGSHSAPPERKRLDVTLQQCRHGIPVVHTLFLDSLMGSLVISNDDTRCLFALSMLYAMLKNKGLHRKLLEAFSLRPKSKPYYSRDQTSPHYNSELVACLLSILDSCTATSNCIRLVTLRLAIMVLLEIVDAEKGVIEEGATASVGTEHTPVMHDQHIALVESIYESAILKLRLHYKGPNDEIFLEVFEQEYENEKTFKLNVPYLMMDEAMLLPPTDTPQSGIDFTRRLPSGEYEKRRKVMRVFFAIRALSQKLSEAGERELPLTPPTSTYNIGDTLDTAPHDLVMCKVASGEMEEEHFMMVTDLEFLLVDPHKSKLGIGVVHFIAFLQDLDVSGDPADGRALFIIAYNRKSAQKRPALSGRFIFEDHIRCSAARNFLQRSRDNLHLSKMTRISKLLCLPPPESLSSVPSLPGSHRALNQQQILNLSDITPPSILGATPTLAMPTPPCLGTDSDTCPIDHLFSSPSQQITSSVLHRVFVPPPSEDVDSSPQTIELLSLIPSNGHLPTQLPKPSLPPALPLGMFPLLDHTPVRLTVPIPEDNYHTSSGTSNGTEIGGRGMMTSMSPTPEPQFPDEEGLTASGGLLQQQRMPSSERSREESIENSLEMSLENSEEVDTEIDTVCPLGLELIAENESTERLMVEESHSEAASPSDDVSVGTSRRNPETLPRNKQSSSGVLSGSAYEHITPSPVSAEQVQSVIAACSERQDHSEEVQKLAFSDGILNSLEFERDGSNGRFTSAGDDEKVELNGNVRNPGTTDTGEEKHSEHLYSSSNIISTVSEHAQNEDPKGKGNATVSDLTERKCEVATVSDQKPNGSMTTEENQSTSSEETLASDSHGAIANSDAAPIQDSSEQDYKLDSNELTASSYDKRREQSAVSEYTNAHQNGGYYGGSEDSERERTYEDEMEMLL